MGKKIGMIVLTFVLLFATGFTVVGLVVRSKLHTSELLGARPKNLASRLEVMAKPTECGNVALQKEINIGYTFSQVMVDCCYQEEEYGKSISYSKSYLMIDSEGNVIQEGDTVVVANMDFPEEVSLLKYLNNDYFVGQLAMRKCFTIEQRQQLADIMNPETMRIRLDCYYVDKGWYYPEHISLVEAGEVILEMDCTIPAEVTATTVEEDPRWLAIQSTENFHLEPESEMRKEELRLWAQKHLKDILKGNKDINVSNPLKGCSMYGIITNSQYALVLHAEMDYSAVTVMVAGILLGVSAVLTAVIWTIVFVVGMIRNRR